MKFQIKNACGVIEEKVTCKYAWVFVLLLFFINVAATCRDMLHRAIHNLHDITGYEISEFLINFHGGFVRRGLVGEILYQICYPISLDPRVPMVVLCIISGAVLLYILVKRMREAGLLLWVLPTTLVFAGGDSIRKDYLIMLLFCLMLDQTSKLLKGQNRTILIVILCVLLLNVHEASFFIFFPMLSACILFAEPSKISKVQKIVILAAPVLTMALLCICKGNAACAKIIYDSWTFIYPEEYSHFHCENAIGALAWETLPSIRWHFQINFISGPYFQYAGIVVRPLILFVILYLLVQASFHGKAKTESYAANTTKFINISIFQLVAMIPLFTVLSCDFRRCCFYWTVSSLIAYSTLKDMRIVASYGKGFIGKQTRLHSMLSRPISLMTVLFMLSAINVPDTHNHCAEYLSPLFQKVYWKASDMIHEAKKV